MYRPPGRNRVCAATARTWCAAGRSKLGCVNQSYSVVETSWRARLRIAGMFKLLISLRRRSWRALDGYMRREDEIMSSARTARVTQLIQLPQGKSFRSEEHTSELQSLTNLVCR